MIIQNSPDFNKLKLNEKKIERIKVYSFVNHMPDFSFKFEDVSVTRLMINREKSILEAIMLFCKTANFPIQISDTIIEVRKTDKSFRSNISVIEIDMKNEDFEKLDLNLFIGEEVVLKKIQSILTVIGFMNLCYPKYYGSIFVAFYEGGGAAFQPFFINEGYNYSRYGIDNIKSYGKVLEGFKNNKLVYSISRLFISALSEDDLELGLLKLWFVLEDSADFFISTNLSKKKSKSFAKKKKVHYFLENIELEGGDKLLNKINFRYLDYLYDIRNDIVHSGEVRQRTIGKYSDLKKNSMQDLHDFSSYIVRIAITSLLGGRVKLADDFLEKYL